jgi:phage tail sheath protein FI
MAERLTPGVYVVEVSGGAKTIQGVSTSTAGFIGEAARGIPDRAEFVNGFSDFDRKFGGHRRGEAGFLAQAVEAFFNTGGRRAYVVRVLPADAQQGASEVIAARTPDAWGLRREVLQFEAQGNGAWSEHIRIHIEPSTAFQDQAFRVRVEWTEAGRSRTVETFDNVRMDPNHEDYVGEVINETSKYIQVTDLFEAFLDAADRPLPPLPEQVPGLDTVPAGSDGFYRIPEDVRFEFRWRDNAAGFTTDPDDPDTTPPPRVTFDNASVIAAGGTFEAGEARLTAVQLRDLLANALDSALFRVLIPAGPAELLSEEGPWDTSGGAQASVRIDTPPDRQLVFTQTTPASLNLGAGPFGGLAAGSTIELTVNGAAPQTYALVAGDAADFATGMTATELAVVLNREFTGVQAFIDGANNLTLRTDQRGPAASLALAGTAAGALGNPPAASGAGNVSDPAAVTAAELAAIFNALPNNPFEARVEGLRVAFVQTDLSQPHTIQWVSDPGPDTIVSDLTAHTGPAPLPEPNVRLEPVVASRAYLLFRLMEGSATFNFAGINTVNFTATDGTTAVTYAVNVGGATLTPRALVDLLQDTLATQPNPHGVEADAAGEYVVLSAGPRANGVVLSVATAPAGPPPPWRSLQALVGQAGMVVDAQAGVEISVSEVIRPGVPRSLGTLLPSVRAVGLDQNSQANPLLRPGETEDTPLRLLGGTDGAGLVSLSQYRGTVTADGRRTGLRAFDTADINLLLMPGKNEPGFLSAAMAYCDANDVFFIADGVGSVDRQFQMSADEARQFVEGLPARSNNAAMFYPWIEVPDPVGVGRNPRRFVPPSGHMAGIFARTDATRGVWKAPAGIEAVVSGASDLQHRLIDADQDLLNPIGLNCLRQFPNIGIVSWGARTLASDPEWRYVPVRRTALFLKESLRRGLQWAVFEPNDDELWDRIRINITAFMLGLFRQGAFQGTTPDEAFRVKCDRDTNPQELVDQGIVTAQVAFAPLKPAEFVVIEISQKSLVG